MYWFHNDVCVCEDTAVVEKMHWSQTLRVVSGWKLDSIWTNSTDHRWFVTFSAHWPTQWRGIFDTYNNTMQQSDFPSFHF